MKGSLIIVGFFVLGAFCGAFHLLPFDIGESRVSFYVLCGLMFSVGLSIGNDPQTLKNFRALNPRLVFLPIATILGTLGAAALVSLLLPHRSVADCMAVGSGMGYYSLSSIFITEYKGPELGTVALLSNISVNHDAVVCPFTGPLVWQSGAYSLGRSHHHGYHIAYHYPLRRTAVCCSFDFPWLCDRFQCPVSGHLLLFDLSHGMSSKSLVNKAQPPAKE